MKQTKYIKTLMVALFGCTTAIAQHPEPQLAKDIVPGSASGINGYYTAVTNNKLFFAVYDTSGNSEPWISDGTEAGTTMLKNIAYISTPFPFDADGEPIGFTSIGDKTIFVSNYPVVSGSLLDREPYVSDGTAAGTVLLKNINAAFLADGSNASHFCNIGDKVIFAANDGVHGKELWVTDGTTLGTFMLKDIQPGSTGVEISNIYKIGNKGYVPVNKSGTSSLWVTDGTVAGTIEVKSNIACQELISFDGKIFMTASTSFFGEDRELWTTDGTSAGTLLFKDINVGTGSSSPSLFTICNGKLYFKADDGVHGEELWACDGTVAGTQIVKDIFPGTGDAAISELFAYENKLFFGAQSSVDNVELFMTDGTEAGTQAYPALAPSSKPFNPGYFINYNGRLYFGAKSIGAGYHYWCVEGAGNAPFRVMPADVDDAAFGALFEGHFHREMNGSLYFSAMYKSNIGVELYKLTTTPYAPTATTNLDVARHISIYPNPFTNEIVLDAEVPVFTISVVDINGRTVWQQTNSGSTKTVTINTADWVSGVYFATINTTNNRTITKTLVKH